MQWCYWQGCWYHEDANANSHITKNVMLHFISIILTKRMWWYHWCCCWQYMMLTPTPMAPHDQKNHVAPNFNSFGLRNAMVPLTVPSVSHDTNTSTMWHWHWQQWCHMIKKLCCTSFWLSWLNKCSGATDNAISIRWCWCWCQWHYMIKKVCCTSFESSWP